MFFILDLKRKLDKQSDSIHAKLFVFNSFNCITCYSFHFLFMLHLCIPLFLLFVCKYLLFSFYSIVSEIVYMRNCFIHDLKLENDRGVVKTSFVFLSLVFKQNEIYVLLKYYKK